VWLSYVICWIWLICTYSAVSMLSQAKSELSFFLVFLMYRSHDGCMMGLHQYSHKILFGTCTMLHNCCKLASCKPNQLCQDFDKLLCLNCSMSSYDHYTVFASFKVHQYASQTQPESPNNFLFADVVVIVIDNDNSYSSSESHWVALKRFWANGFTWYMPETYWQPITQA
jgi:hypothetical protein